MKSDSEWRDKLSDEQFRVLRECGTEPPFRNAYWDNHDDGTYKCAACGVELFDSETKFDSGTGWPSFTEPKNLENIETLEDRSMGMTRIEVSCANCKGHLGHVFPDGPSATRERYCINSASLDFVKR